MSNNISEEKIQNGINQLNWLIENTDENKSDLISDRRELEQFNENFYGTSANENINGGKSVKSQPSEIQTTLMKAKLLNIETKYKSYPKGSNTQK